MRILLTGITGYVGKRLLPILVNQGHEVTCCARNLERVPENIKSHPNTKYIAVDFLDIIPESIFEKDYDVAYYLIHSMSTPRGDFEELELLAASNFRQLMDKITVKQVIYLGGIYNDIKLSKHLRSRMNVELELKKGNYAFTALHAGIIIGSGSASFEIIRDLVEKLPIMITPHWVLTLSQPIGIRDVLKFLLGVMLRSECMNKDFDIGGTDVLSYRDMLLQYAEVRKLKRRVVALPIMTPRLSSYWLFFVTSTSFNLALHLVNSLKVEVIAKDNELSKILDITTLSYKEAVEAAFTKIRQNQVSSSWKDSLISSQFSPDYPEQIEVPIFGCYKDTKKIKFKTNPDKVLHAVWSIGGNQGWYYANFLWKLRGYLDKLWGGIGLRRGRTNVDELQTGDALDFWRVLLADKKGKRLLLYAEMVLPGEAWLEFKIRQENDKHVLIQTATFRPVGVMGRLYWILSWPFHIFIFRGMAQNIVRAANKK
ncbi:SDR family oxidoreductase [Sunxiuqinia sp. A32]|uniref:SDR family oxidoreductase n=1 Tax=Sunxiuqinia sp. A32 TaxID=3461496 RepID=UPI0040453F70